MDVSRETFEKSDRDTQNLILFDTLNALHGKFDSFNGACEKRHVKIDDDMKKIGRTSKAFSAGGGIIGGILTVLSSKIFNLG